MTDRLAEMQKQEKVIAAHMEFDQGQIYWQMAFLDEAEINMDAVYDAMDCYKNAANMANNNDVELECISSYYLGRLYYLGLKNL